MEGFRALYHIPRGVFLRYGSPGEWLTHKNEWEVVIPMIAFIEGGMWLGTTWSPIGCAPQMRAQPI